MALKKKCGEKKKDGSAIKEAAEREYTISIHRMIHGVAFRKHALRTLKEIRKFVIKEMKIPDVGVATRPNQAVWVKGRRNVPYYICVRVFRKHNEKKDSPNKLYILVTYLSVTALKKSTNNQGG